MRTSIRSNQFFDTRSVLLFAAISLGAGVALHVHAADSTPAAANPANQPPAMTHKKAPPPMTTSPAFGPTNKAAGAGAAHNPDVRPEVTATMPSASAKDAFDRADVNRDGKLSAAELKTVPGLAERMQAVDANHDAVVSRAEFDADVRR